jgi:hypothetical protein
MAKKVYYEGKLIPVKDWDYELKKPKVKVQKEVVETVVETQPEVETN